MLMGYTRTLKFMRKIHVRDGNDDKIILRIEQRLIFKYIHIYYYYQYKKRKNARPEEYCVKQKRQIIKRFYPARTFFIIVINFTVFICDEMSKSICNVHVNTLRSELLFKSFLKSKENEKCYQPPTARNNNAGDNKPYVQVRRTREE